MGIYHLEKFFDPASIAVIGASPKKKSVGHAALTNLLKGGFEGKLLPVNPNYSQIEGLRCHPSVSQANEHIDLAVIAAPITTVPDIIRECVDANVESAIIISAGGKETGPEGRKIEEEIDRIARKGGLRILGPNCMGIIRPGKKLNASFAAHMPYRGKLAFISQSGAICSAMLDLSMRERLGFSYFVSIGSMMDVDFGDLIDYLGNDSESATLRISSTAPNCWQSRRFQRVPESWWLPIRADLE